MIDRIRMAWRVLRGRVSIDEHESPVVIEDGWGDEPIETAFVQWKGTDVCMDASCPVCGADGHVHGMFAYFLRCVACGAVIQVGSYVPLRALRPGDGRLYDDAVYFLKHQPDMTIGKGEVKR